MRAVVWMDSWQQQCCGAPFVVGTEVSWHLEEPDHEWLEGVLGDVATTVTHCEEHHDTMESPTTQGEVLSIRAVHCRYAPVPGAANPRMHYPVDGSTVFTPVQVADGWEPMTDDLDFAGYLIELDLLPK